MSEDKKKCERHRISPYKCRRIARNVRVTNSGYRVALCDKCDQTKINGKTIGDIVEGIYQ